MKILRRPKFWNLHTHSKFSHNDALPSVDSIVNKVAGMGHGAIGLTDHGNMAGTVQLYKSAKKAGIKPFPGTELYVVHDRADKKAKRHHMCVAAYTTQGYKNLVRLNTYANYNFYRKPLLDHTDFARMHDDGLLEGIAATSGCYFGYIAQAVSTGNESKAKELMLAYSKWFDKFYVELQNHNIVHDDETGMNDDQLAQRLYELASSLGIPCLITQDSHYVDLTDKPTHETLKRLVAYGDDADDAVFPGDGFQLANTEWVEERHNSERLQYGYEGLDDLYYDHELSIKQLDSYSYNIPFTVLDPQQELQDKVYERCEDLKLGPNYYDRINEELSVVKDTGMAGYLMLVKQVVDWCKDNHVFYQARGSASGSILCWLLDITQADPIKHDLRYERFISRDRTKPPDIDLDVEHTRRQDLIHWLEDRFAVHQIGTWLEHSLDDSEEGKGSLKVKYYAKARRLNIPLKGWQSISPDVKKSLRDLSSFKAYSSYGTHAAGLIVTTTKEEFDDLVPLLKVASSKTYVSQYPMSDVEQLGLVKLDVLGLKALSILNKCMQNLGRDVFDGLDWIPFNDRKTYKTIASGNTDGVFQLEGYSARSGVRRLQPTKLSDVIVSMALFRKATMNTGATDTYIARKHKQERVPVRHELIDEVVSPTYGIFVYQEQVISILRNLGMDADNLTSFLKAIKASNASIGDAANVIGGYKSSIKELADNAGVSDEDFNWLWSAFEGFAEYSFNKAHATAYGITAYRCAYLATNYPVEFFAAVLNVWAGDPKEAQYITAARSQGVSIFPPHVNTSYQSYETHTSSNGSKNVVKGLLAIKGVGLRAANRIIDKRPEDGYTSVEQFCRLVGSQVSGAKAFITSDDLDSGVVGILMNVGALDGLPIYESNNVEKKVSGRRLSPAKKGSVKRKK